MPHTITIDTPVELGKPTKTEPKPETPNETKFGLTDVVKTSRGDFTIQDLLEAKAQAEQLQNQTKELNDYRSAVQYLLDPDVVDPGVKGKALRYVLSAEGYGPEEIERQVAIITNSSPVEADEPAAEGEETPNQPTGQRQPSVTEGLVESLQAALTEQEKQTNKIRVRMLRAELDRQVGSILDSDQEVAKLVKKVKEIRGDDAEQGIKVLREDIADRAVKELSKKAALTGQRVEDDWVASAVQTAAKEVRQRSLFGSPDAIGKAPTVEASGDKFKNRTPVPAPEFTRGDSMAEVSNKVRGHLTDVLARLAVQSGTGETKA